MPIAAATHRLGPENATLSVRTGRTGAVAKVGHDLLLHVTAWEATIELGEDPAETKLTLTADPTSLRVREGTGGIQALGDDDVANIHQTIDDEVLLRREIAFRSTAVRPGPEGSMHVEGELTLAGAGGSIAFDLTLGDDGAVVATAVVKQSDWKLKPYTTLFGALKVADEVEVALAGRIEV
jgi:polyisoprenoid-binding protein YceI